MGEDTSLICFSSGCSVKEKIILSWEKTFNEWDWF